MTAVQQIDRFVKDLGTRHLHQVLGQVLARWGLVLAVGLLLFYDFCHFLHLFLPGLLPWTLVAALACLLIVAGIAFGRRNLALGEVDRRLELQDRLTTWQHLRRRGEPTATPMALWLADDLVERIESIPEPRRRAAVGRPVGALRYLLPVLIVLLLLQLLIDFGAAGGGGSGMGSPGAGGTGAASGGAGADANSEAGEPGDAPPTDGRSQGPPPPTAPLPEPPLDGTPPPLEPNKPLAEDLEVRDEFAVPHFVGEGESRRQLARQARVAEPPPPPAAGQVSPGEQLPDPEETDFQRAYERALQSRHVPEHERPFLRRYFRILREGSR